MITSGPCPHRTYRIAGVSPCSHAAPRDFAGVLLQGGLGVSWSLSGAPAQL